MVAIGSNIYIFGGLGYNYLNDLYKININNNVSEKINLTGDDIPEKRTNHYMVIVDNYMYIFGGYNSYFNDSFGRYDYIYFNDLYKIDTYGNSKKIPSSYFNDYLNFNDYKDLNGLNQKFNITATNNDIYTFFLRLTLRIINAYNINIESTTVSSGSLFIDGTKYSHRLLKITPANRDYHLNGNIAELRINNVITSDNEIIDNYSSLNNNYNST